MKRLLRAYCLLLGAFSFVFDGLLGLTPPIVADRREEAAA